MDHLFQLAWYKIGIDGRKEPDRLVAADRERWTQEKVGMVERGEEVEYVQDNERKFEPR